MSSRFDDLVRETEHHTKQIDSLHKDARDQSRSHLRAVEGLSAEIDDMNAAVAAQGAANAQHNAAMADLQREQTAHAAEQAAHAARQADLAEREFYIQREREAAADRQAETEESELRRMYDLLKAVQREPSADTVLDTIAEWTPGSGSPAAFHGQLARMVQRCVMVAAHTDELLAECSTGRRGRVDHDRKVDELRAEVEVARPDLLAAIKARNLQPFNIYSPEFDSLRARNLEDLIAIVDGRLGLLLQTPETFSPLLAQRMTDDHFRESYSSDIEAFETLAYCGCGATASLREHLAAGMHPNDRSYLTEDLWAVGLTTSLVARFTPEMRENIARLIPNRNVNPDAVVTITSLASPALAGSGFALTSADLPAETYATDAECVEFLRSRGIPVADSTIDHDFFASLPATDHSSCPTCQLVDATNDGSWRDLDGASTMEEVASQRFRMFSGLGLFRTLSQLSGDNRRSAVAYAFGALSPAARQAFATEVDRELSDLFKFVTGDATNVYGELLASAKEAVTAMTERSERWAEVGLPAEQAALADVESWISAELAYKEAAAEPAKWNTGTLPILSIAATAVVGVLLFLGFARADFSWNEQFSTAATAEAGAVWALAALGATWVGLFIRAGMKLYPLTRGLRKTRKRLRARLERSLENNGFGLSASVAAQIADQYDASFTSANYDLRVKLHKVLFVTLAAGMVAFWPAVAVALIASFYLAYAAALFVGAAALIGGGLWVATRFFS